MLALQVNELSAHVGSVAAALRDATPIPAERALFEETTKDLLLLSESVLRLVDTLPPEAPSQERIGGNGH